MKINNVNTPAVLIDRKIAKNNINKYQKWCDKHNIKLRPHIKTHKINEIAKWQIKQGAIGIACQKISEAEAMIKNGGIKNIMITYNIIGKEKIRKLKKLNDKINVCVVADNETVVEELNKEFKNNKKKLNVLVECNTGANRCGVTTPKQAAELAKKIENNNNLKFAGLMTYPPVNKTKQINQWLEKAIKKIKNQGLDIKIVSGGGSPDMWNAHKIPQITEYRIGTYIYNDRSLVEKGVCKWDDCALTVLATVVSVPTNKRAIIDAGSKILTSDLLGLKGHGYVVGRKDILIDQLSEEHGRLTTHKKSIGLKVGDKIRIVPNHCCVVTNMMDYVTLVEEDNIIKNMKVTARGKVV